MTYKHWPVREAVRSRQHKLGVGKAAGLAVSARERAPAELFNLRSPSVYLDGKAGRDDEARERSKALHPLTRPIGKRCRLTGFADADEIFGELPVLGNAGARREGQGVLRIGEHANLLSLHACWSATIRLKEGSKP